MAGKKAPGLRITRLEAAAKAKGLGQPALTDEQQAAQVYKVYERFFELGHLLIDDSGRLTVNPLTDIEYPPFDTLPALAEMWNQAFVIAGD